MKLLMSLEHGPETVTLMFQQCWLAVLFCANLAICSSRRPQGKSMLNTIVLSASLWIRVGPAHGAGNIAMRNSIMR